MTKETELYPFACLFVRMNRRELNNSIPCLSSLSNGPRSKMGVNASLSVMGQLPCKIYKIAVAAKPVLHDRNNSFHFSCLVGNVEGQR